MRSSLLLWLFLASALAAADPWHPLVGEPVSGVTLSDGWYDARLSALYIEGGWTDSASVSADGKYVLFSYSQYDFPTWYRTLGEEIVISGPSLLDQPAPFRNFRYDVVTGTIDLLPVNSPSASAFAASPAMNANEDVYVQTWWSSGASGPAELVVSFKTTGTWTMPVGLPSSINLTGMYCHPDNGFVFGTAMDFRLYFESKRPSASGTRCDGYNRSRIWRADYTWWFGFAAPVPVWGISTETSDDYQPSVSPDGTSMYWTSVRDGVYGIFAGTIDSTGSVGNVRPVITVDPAASYAGKIVAVGEPSIAQGPTTQLLYFVCGIAEDATATTIKLRMCVARKGDE